MPRKTALPDRAAGHLTVARSARPGAFAGADVAACDAAYVALEAGCRFLIARGAAPGGFAPPPVIAVRRACNCLKELDRFLIVLIDACALAYGAPHGTRALYVREGDAAARLCRVRPLRAAFANHIPRLRAIGRIRALSLGDAPAEAASRPMADLALATMGYNLAEQAPNMPFVLGDQTLAVVAAFYLALGDQLRDIVVGPLFV